MHVLLIHQAFVSADEPGGTRHYELAARLAEKGHRVTIVAGRRNYLTGGAAPPRDQVVAGVDVRRVRALGSVHRSFRSRLIGFITFLPFAFAAAVRVKEVDAVWGTSPPIFQTLVAWIVARIKRVPYVLEIRDLWPWAAIEAGLIRGRMVIGSARYLERFLYRRADAMVVNSPGFIQHIASSGISESRIGAVPNSVEVEAFVVPVRRRNQVRTQFGWSGKTVAIYAGAHGMANHLDTILDAAALLRNNDRILFVLVGDGKEKPRLVERARALGLSNLQFLPPSPKNMMPDLLAAADVGVLTLRSGAYFDTVFPNKVFDYMAAAKPTILCIGGPMRDVIEKSGGGVCVPSGDSTALAEAVADYAEHPRIAQAHGRKARAFAKANFDRSTRASELERLFESVLSS